MNPTLAPSESKANEAAELAKKVPFLVYWSGVGKVYTEIVPDCAKRTLQSIIKGKVEPDSIIHSDHWRGYDGRWPCGSGLQKALSS
jgi:transposase-like protein